MLDAEGESSPPATLALRLPGLRPCCRVHRALSSRCRRAFSGAEIAGKAAYVRPRRETLEISALVDVS
jgi:hypothetical protein